jgi:hypothetical protein
LVDASADPVVNEGMTNKSKRLATVARKLARAVAMGDQHVARVMLVVLLNVAQR